MQQLLSRPAFTFTVDDACGPVAVTQTDDDVPGHYAAHYRGEPKPLVNDDRALFGGLNDVVVRAMDQRAAIVAGGDIGFLQRTPDRCRMLFGGLSRHVETMGQFVAGRPYR
ncbi:hypothetical protein [Cupriavidus sp. AU9028]|uniref:hypothetical protein n=1 Tax=Cupriavidus sp. AU9028 TaxID=2871157 RepID=UPI0021023008|nr:hypothetical protein [Cupriavidus sp. AU9028]